MHACLHSALHMQHSSRYCSGAEQQCSVFPMMQANPELMKQSLEMMRTMPPDQLQAAAQAAGAPPGFFSADRMEELAAQVHPHIAIK